MTNWTRLPSTYPCRWAAAILLLAVVLSFSGALSNDLVDWDDHQILVQNEAYRGFTAAHLAWMFTTGFAGHYQPLSWLSFAVDHGLWGVDPFGFHLTNLLLHACTSVAFLFVARRLIAAACLGQATPERARGAIVAASPDATRPLSGGQIPPYTGTAAISANAVTLGALIAALLFAVHPLRVESVAWATERRDVLSGAWLTLAVLCYLRAVDPTLAPRRYTAFVVSWVCYVLSLLSKAGGIALPVILLAIDWYPLRRFSGAAHRAENRLRTILVEKLWFALPAVAIAPVALWAQAHSGALRSLDEHNLTLRIGQAFFGAAFYLWKSLAPIGLVPLYEQRPDAAWHDPPNLLAAAIVIALTILFLRLRRRTPALLCAWIAYLAFLAPVLGLAQSGPQVVADRYSYFSCMGWAIVLGGASVWMWRWTLNGRRNADTRRSAEASPTNSRGLKPTARLPATAHGGAFLIAAVIPLIVVALMIHATRNQTLIWRDSYTLWTTVLQRAPGTPTAHANLAVIHNNRSEFAAAREHARRALAVLPGNRSAHLSLARAASELGDLPVALEHFRTTMKIDEHTGRKDPTPLLGLAVVHTRRQAYDDAEAAYRQLIDLEPLQAEWHVNLGSFLASRDRHAEAEQGLKRAISLQPNHVQAAYRLSVLQRSTNDAAAIETLVAALATTPDEPTLTSQLALILATSEVASLRDPPRALQLAKQTVNGHGRTNPLAHEALAVSLAAVGDRAAARSTIERLLANPDVPLSDTARARLRSKLPEYSP